MLTRTDLLSPSKQDKNAGNSGDLVKHISYLALLRELARGAAPAEKLQVVEAQAGKGMHVSAHHHLLKARRCEQYAASTLGRAQTACFAPPPAGLGDVAGLNTGEVVYAGSAALHGRALADGLTSSLTLLDSDAGVRTVLGRVFSEPCYSAVRAQVAIEDPGGPSEQTIASRLRDGHYRPTHVLHFDPFAFVMAEHDANTRSSYLQLVRECDARVARGELGAASVFFTWGSNGAAAKDDLDGAGYLGGVQGGYQEIVSAVDTKRRLVVTWCWEFFFSLLLIVPGDLRPGIARAIEADTLWLKPLMRRLDLR